jgi:FAD/FMN-containing dehydrogenase
VLVGSRSGAGWAGSRASTGLSCDNVEAYTVVTADGETVRATATENPDLFWALRGGGGNFGVVTEFEFRLHPTTGRALMVDRWFDVADAQAPLRAWRDLLADAPREATLTADVITAPEAPFLPKSLHGRSVSTIGYVWVGDLDAARSYLRTIRSIGTPVAEQVQEMRYVELQSIGDQRHHHGLRRYSTGHYLADLSDAAIDAFLSRGIAAGSSEPDLARMPGGGFQGYGGAIAEVAEDESAFSHRKTLVEFFGGATWADPAEDAERMALARAWGAAMEPFATGAYVNALADTGDDVVHRIYRTDTHARLADLKWKYDPDNVFHLNQNVRPAAPA